MNPTRIQYLGRGQKVKADSFRLLLQEDVQSLNC